MILNRTEEGQRGWKNEEFSLWLPSEMVQATRLIINRKSHSANRMAPSAGALRQPEVPEIQFACHAISASAELLVNNCDLL